MAQSSFLLRKRIFVVMPMWTADTFFNPDYAIAVLKELFP